MVEFCSHAISVTPHQSQGDMEGHRCIIASVMAPYGFETSPVDHRLH
jgi:hypothetical protein